MKFRDFEQVISEARLSRYMNACNGNTKKAMVLYRYNLKLSQELFSIISLFEIALRNKIDEHYKEMLGVNWLENSIKNEGMFNGKKYFKTKTIIQNAIRSIGPNITHDRIVAEMDFGFWRFLFVKSHFNVAGKTLLQIFSKRPQSTRQFKFNQKYFFNELKRVNDLRNRIAHHEAICFQLGTHQIDTSYT